MMMTNSSDDFHLKQSMLSLAYAADGPAGVKHDDEAECIIKCVLHDASALNDHWELVWGPAILRDIFKISKNTMFVAQSKNDPYTYAVSIAGTNPSSFVDWVFEDFHVKEQIPWRYGSPPASTSPKISEGTSIGLTILQDLTSGENSLVDFLHSVVEHGKHKRTIYVTGHSLGGALAPTVALWLADTQATWDLDSNAVIKTFAFAGPSPGNEDFANHINSKLPGDQMVVVNNTLDVVPHVWEVDMINKIPHLYGSRYDSSAVSFIIRHILKAVEELNYKRIGKGDQVQPIEGTVEPESGILPFSRFLEEMLYQHVRAYPKALLLEPNLSTTEKDCISKC